MTQHTHVRPFPADPASRAMVVRLPGDRATITGTPIEVGVLLATLDRSGRLAAVSTPVPTGVPGQVLTNVRVVSVQRTTRPAVRRAGRMSGRTWCVVGVAATGTVTAAVWATAVAVAWLVNHWAVLVGGAVALVAAVALTRAEVCGGLHCPGCRHR